MIGHYVSRRVIVVLCVGVGGVGGLGVFACGSRTGLFQQSGEAASAPREVCNGIDDDRNGLIDDAIPSRTCGLGPCAVTVAGCDNGVVPDCTPRLPQPEVCDGIDNDCNGAIDDGLPLNPVVGPITIARESAFPESLQLELTADGFRSFWNVGFLGENPKPDLHTRAIANDGSPRGDVTTIMTRPMLNGPRTTPVRDKEEWLAVYCGRPAGMAEDRLMSVHIGADGNIRGTEHTRIGSDRGCGAAFPDAIFTGSHELYAMTTSSAPPSSQLFPVVMEIAGHDEATIRVVELFPGGNLYAAPRFAQAGDAVLMVVGVQDVPGGPSQLGAFVFGNDGSQRAGPIRIANPKGLQVPHVVAVTARPDQTFAILMRPDDNSHGLYWARMSHEGALLAELTLLDGAPYDYSRLDFVANGSAFVAAGDAVITEEYEAVVVHALSSEDGRVTSTWTTPRSEGVTASPSIVLHDGRVWVLYQLLSAPEIRLVALGCKP